MDIEVASGVTIPESELSFSFSRSSGPGGQNVNKVETKVRLEFDVAASPSLTAAQKTRLQEQLASRISQDGKLRLSCQRHRSREANRQEAVRRFQQLLRRGLEARRPRRASAVPAAERRRRLTEKKRRSRLKQLRARPGSETT